MHSVDIYVIVGISLQISTYWELGEGNSSNDWLEADCHIAQAQTKQFHTGGGRSGVWERGLAYDQTPQSNGMNYT